jgi:flagellar FliJ protein
MVPSKRFQPVQRVAESREKSAAKVLGDSQRNMQAQQAKLGELKQYHQEYLERFETAARNGMSANQLQEYRAFLDKLDKAIKEQEKVVLATQFECSKRKDEWQKKRIRTQALGKAVERMQSAEQKERDSREQKELDERNQRGRFNG